MKIDHLSNIENVVIGCVADNTPKYLDQALRLLQSVRWFGGRWADVEFHVCLIEEDNPAYREKYARYGAKVHVVPRFSVAHPPSNKLRFLQLPELSEADRVVLLDCDTIVAQDPSDHLEGADFIAKIADAPTVTPAVFERLFKKYGIRLPEQHFECSVRGEPIIPYFNAGVLSFSRHAMDTLVRRWIELTASLSGQLGVLGECSNFCEQASLSLALQDCETAFRVLPNACNFPAHFLDMPRFSAFGQTDPVIIHYHSLVDGNGKLLPSPYPHVDMRITAFNQYRAAEN